MARFAKVVLQAESVSQLEKKINEIQTRVLTATHAQVIKDKGITKILAADLELATYTGHEKSLIKDSFYRLSADPALGNRFRAYSKLAVKLGERAVVMAHEPYEQSIENNYDLGGQKRALSPVEDCILESDTLQACIQTTLHLAVNSGEFSADEDFQVGIHQVRYLAIDDQTSFASPKGFHKDDERIVSVYLVDRSKNALGGSNPIAHDGKREVSSYSLSGYLDSITFDRSIYHAVTPLASNDGLAAFRDVFLVTVLN